MTLRHLACSLGVLLALAGVLAAPASARPSAVVAFLDGPDAYERIAARGALAPGFVSATQGRYERRQFLLDLTQGNRVSRSGYEPPELPRFEVSGRRIAGWNAIVERARTAPTPIVPGLLGGAVPGGAAYAGPPGAVEAVVAADRRGRLGRAPRAALAPGASAGNPAGARLLVTIVGDAALDRLLATRPRDRLVIVIARPPADVTQANTLAIGIAGLGSGILRSRTTRRPGLVSSTDVTRTVLDWLRVPVPSAVRGRPITASGERDVEALRAAEARLRAVYPRRFPVLASVAVSLALAAVALTVAGRRRTAARICGLAVLWIPFASLLAAALAPSRLGEMALMGLGTLALAALTDRLVAWPRGPAVPALAAVLAYAIDLALGSELIVRSLLGPNPRFGARFYGIGNELEAVLPPLALIGLAAAAATLPRSRRLAAAFGVAMLALGAVVGVGFLGADAGGVVTIGAAGAAAVVLLLPGGVSRRSVLIALAVPVLAIGALALVELATGGDAHFATTILGAESFDAILETLARRYELAWNSLLRGLMPVVTLLVVVLAVTAVRRRRRIYAPVAGSPAWGAALCGGLAGAVAGALSNDSGPVLLVVGIVVLAFATLYIRGRPAAAVPRGAGERRVPGTPEATAGAGRIE